MRVTSLQEALYPPVDHRKRFPEKKKEEAKHMKIDSYSDATKQWSEKLQYTEYLPPL